MITKIERRLKIKTRIRGKISGTATCPRMTVFRSNKQIYVQLIDDEAGKTLVAASSAGMEKAPKKEVAAKVGQLIAQKAQEAGISTVVFDRTDTSIMAVSKNLPMQPVTEVLNFKQHGKG